MDTYQVPAYWFEPKTLRRWLWVNRTSLAENSKDALREILISGHVIEQFEQADIHTVVRQIILNTDYTDIIGGLDNDDFMRFAIESINFQWKESSISWTPSSFPSLRRVLGRYFDRSNLKPRNSIQGIGEEIEYAATQARRSLEIAGHIGSFRANDASATLRDGCQKAVEKMEYLVKLLLEFRGWFRNPDN